MIVEVNNNHRRIKMQVLVLRLPRSTGRVIQNKVSALLISAEADAVPSGWIDAMLWWELAPVASGVLVIVVPVSDSR